MPVWNIHVCLLSSAIPPSAAKPLTCTASQCRKADGTIHLREPYLSGVIPAMGRGAQADDARLVARRWCVACGRRLGGGLACRPAGGSTSALRTHTHTHDVPLVGLALDFSKCYDLFPLEVLCARRAGVPRDIAEPVVACYAHVRHIRADGLAGATQDPIHWLALGCRRHALGGPGRPVLGEASADPRDYTDDLVAVCAVRMLGTVWEAALARARAHSLRVEEPLPACRASALRRCTLCMTSSARCGWACWLPLRVAHSARHGDMAIRPAAMPRYHDRRLWRPPRGPACPGAALEGPECPVGSLGVLPAARGAAPNVLDARRFARCWRRGVARVALWTRLTLVGMSLAEWLPGGIAPDVGGRLLRGGPGGGGARRRRCGSMACMPLRLSRPSAPSWRGSSAIGGGRWARDRAADRWCGGMPDYECVGSIWWCSWTALMRPFAPL